MQKHMFCITYEKLYILNTKRRAFHEEAPTTKITTDVLHVAEGGIRIHQRCVEYGSFVIRF